MVRYEKGNIFDTHCQVIGHQVNSEGVLGGLAKEVFERYPECLASYRNACSSRRPIVGHVIFVEAANKKFIANLVGQKFPGAATDYAYLCSALLETKSALKFFGLNSLALPYKIGCGIGGGNWEIVKAIIFEIFGNSKEEVVIYKLEG